MTDTSICRSSPKPAGSTLRFEPITLSDGWEGSVLTDRGTLTDDCTASDNLPTVAQWQTILEELVRDPSSLARLEVLKYSKSRVVVRTRFSFGGESVDAVCKRTRPRGLWRRLVAPLARSRERKDFELAAKLIRAGVATAFPLALLERTSPLREAWLVTAFIPDAADLDQIALTLLPRLEGRRLVNAKRAIIEEVVQLFVLLEDRGLHHRDLKASNILMTNWNGLDGPARVHLVDVEGLRTSGLGTAGARWQPLMRLAASLAGYPTVTWADYGRFLKVYLQQAGQPPESWRRRYGELARAAMEYRRKARGRKTHKLDGYTGEV